jgi:hypothetical protein
METHQALVRSWASRGVKGPTSWKPNISWTTSHPELPRGESYMRTVPPLPSSFSPAATTNY